MHDDVVLFGAFDRHNLGDLLLPHVLAAMLPRPPRHFAGLARRDLREAGGHDVHALAALAPVWREHQCLLHVGGEVLTCAAWPAAVMLQPAEGLQATLAYLAARPAVRSAWVRRVLGSASPAPYAVTRPPLPAAARVIFHAVGGVGLAHAPRRLRTAVLGQLAAAESVSVRDRWTQRALHEAGIAAALVPDPATLVAELFAPRIREHAAGAELQRLHEAFAQGWLALQFSAEFGDDRTLARLALQAARVIDATGLGVALFCAGRAPWHDDPAALPRLAALLPGHAVRIVASANIWTLCALIAASRLYAGSSLHGRIVAMAFARPRLNLLAAPPRRAPSKAGAYAACWDLPELPGAVGVDALAAAAAQALAVDGARLQAHAAELSMRCRAGLQTLLATLR